MNTISREDLKAVIDSRQPATVIEASDEHEYNKAHLPGALRLTADEAANGAAELLPDKDARIIVYCDGGECKTSRALADELRRQGFSKVTIYEGGKQDWVEAGYTTLGAVIPTPERRK